MNLEDRLTFLLENTHTTSKYADIDPNDPYIGSKIGGVRKTEGGWVWTDPDTAKTYWFYQKMFETRDSEGRLVKRDGPYWYKKRSVPDEDSKEGRRIDEVYVGKSLPFEIPKDLRGGLMVRHEDGVLEVVETPEQPKASSFEESLSLQLGKSNLLS